jgi:RNA polymerase sigma-70 factor (ECF subfamily)
MGPEVLASLIDRHAAALELYARSWCDDPEDVVQVAFVKLAGLPRPPDQPAAWLFRVVRHEAINAGRASRRRRRHEGRAKADVTPWFEPDPGAAIDAREATAALMSLPIEQREVVVARLWGGLTFEQVAALVVGSSSGVHRVYHEALRTLRERLGVPWKPIPK